MLNNEKKPRYSLKKVEDIIRKKKSWVQRNNNNIMDLSKEVAEFTKELRLERIEKKKSPYIASIFQRKRQSYDISRPIKLSSLFKSESYQESEAFFQYQMLYKIMEEKRHSKTNMDLSNAKNERKDLLQNLLHGRKEPKILFYSPKKIPKSYDSTLYYFNILDSGKNRINKIYRKC